MLSTACLASKIPLFSNVVVNQLKNFMSTKRNGRVVKACKKNLNACVLKAGARAINIGFPALYQRIILRNAFSSSLQKKK